MYDRSNLSQLGILSNVSYIINKLPHFIINIINILIYYKIGKIGIKIAKYKLISLCFLCPKL